ncbi:MAG: hypothetical protein H0W11_12005, partial [Gemmatimonadetes bacterium]|nr:hypothetical protein [Gemmatimonadota bacterium]
MVAFEQALVAGQLAEALRLYRGEFLPGFLISNAPEFERWVERERTRLRGRATRAMHSLAEEREAVGDMAGAAEWWRRLAAEEPLDSRISLRLMQALAAVGDRAGALQHARVHTTLLREELEVEPDPEVVALAERLRSEPAAAPMTPRVASGAAHGNGSDAGAPAAIAGPLDAAAAPVAEPPSGAPSPARGTEGTEAPPTSPGGVRGGRFLDRSSRRAIPLFFLLLVVLIIVAYALWERRSPDAAADMPTRVAVFPFAVRGSEEVAYLDEGMVTLLSTNLDGAGE